MGSYAHHDMYMHVVFKYTCKYNVHAHCLSLLYIQIVVIVEQIAQFCCVFMTVVIMSKENTRL